MRSASFAPTWVAIVVAVVACQAKDEASPKANAQTVPSQNAAPQHLRVTLAPPVGDLPAAVRDEMTRAAAERRRVVVYVGAEWCEPCSKFLRAAENGELNRAFGDVTLLRFDSERDRDRLRAAGYTSRYIPLLVLPTADGTSSGKQIEGGITGDGAVAEIAGRLKDLLEN